MIASPSDVQSEREIAQEVIAEWNAVHSRDRSIVLLPLVWERDATPVQGERPQALINTQVLRKADVLIAIFWGRIGSPTGVAPSGTVEELTEHLKANKPALLYFSSVPVPPNTIDPEQLKALNIFQKEAQRKGLYDSFASPDEFRRKLTRHISKIVVEHRMFASTAQATGEEHTPIQLSRTEEDILVASLDDGLLLRIRSASYGELLRAGRRDFVNPDDPAYAARHMEAFERLKNRGLVRQESSDVFRLTGTGFDHARYLREWRSQHDRTSD